jgi:hypothetical protein
VKKQELKQRDINQWLVRKPGGTSVRAALSNPLTSNRSTKASAHRALLHLHRPRLSQLFKDGASWLKDVTGGSLDNPIDAKTTTSKKNRYAYQPISQSYTSSQSRSNSTQLQARPSSSSFDLKFASIYHKLQGDAAGYANTFY